MPAIDNDLVLGRGKIMFQPYLLNETSGGVRGDFGNAPTFTLATTSQSLDHYSSRKGLKVLDRTVVLQEDQSATFTLDEINLGNMAFWFGVDIDGVEPADAPADLGDLQLIGDAKSIYGGLFFEADNPIGGNRNFWWPYVNLQPNGNFDMLGDTWQTMGFTAKILKRDTLTARVYVYQTADGSSVGDTDTSPLFTPMTAAVVGGTVATGGTITEADTTQNVDVPFSAAFTLTGGSVAYVFLHDGTSITGSAHTISGASGTVDGLVATVTGTYTAKVYGNPAGTGSVLATSAAITVS